jgi:hypothetical protein
VLRLRMKTSAASALRTAETAISIAEAGQVMAPALTAPAAERLT